MGWLARWYSPKRRRGAEPLFKDKVGMHQEIRKAHTEWLTAHQRLEWVVEKDQIDYAIYALEAAEKRYEMLLRQAKLMQWDDGLLVASQAQRLYAHAGAQEAGKKSGGQASNF